VDKPSSPQCSYCFGPFRLDIALQQLYKNEEPVELMRRLFRTLQLLVENHGRDLEKTYLMEQLWPNTVVEENNLTVIISMLRKALGDDAGIKKYILTNPGRGYRFVAEVTEVPCEVPEALTPPSTPAASQGALSTRRRGLTGHRLLVTIGLAAGGLLALYFAFLAIGEWNEKRATESIAVLPFQSLGTEHDDYLGLGMADSLIARLRNIRGVVVRPIADITRYQNATSDPLTLGKELRVASLLDGTIEKAGEQISLKVRLLRVKDGAILWSGEYSGRFTDILAMQDQIAEQATRALALKIDSTEEQSIHRHYTGSSEAYQMYIAARYYCGGSNNGPTLNKGIAYFQQATSMDPKFALAYAGLADCYVQLADASEFPTPAQLYSKAEAAAEQGLKVDPSLGELYLPVALAKIFCDWDFPAAEGAFRRSIALAPQAAAAHFQYAQFLIMQGRFREAEREAHTAAQLDPFLWGVDGVLNNVYFFSRRYDVAADRWEKSRSVDLDEAVWYLAWIYAAQGRDIPVQDLLNSEATAARKAGYASELAYVYALKGLKSLALDRLRSLPHYPDKVDDYLIALVYVALGDKQRAFQFLDSAAANRSALVVFANVDPRLESLRSDPRFDKLLRDLHLST
jgi:DNA-binding winged helix-turn-helix (wHTH) protein/TolB-like protein